MFVEQSWKYWIDHLLSLSRTSLVAQTVKHLPTMLETRVQSLGQEDLLEKEVATYSSILAWKIPWVEKPGRSMRSQRVGHNWATSLSLFSLVSSENLWSVSKIVQQVEVVGWGGDWHQCLVVQNMGYGASLPGFESLRHPLLAVWPWDGF